MSNISFGGRTPVIASDAYVAPNATLIGDVTIAGGASIWFGAVLRGDMSPIRIGARSSIQDNCVIHGEAKFGTEVEEDVTVGHGAILHGCRIGRRALIGMGAIILSGAKIGEGCVVAAGTVVLEEFEVPPGMLIAGLPGVIKGPLPPRSQAWVKGSNEAYVELSRQYLLERA